MTDSPSPRPLATFRGPVTCRRTRFALTLTGPAADSQDERLILTFIAPTLDSLPDSLADPAVVALDEQSYRIFASPQEWLIQARSAHVHRDVGAAFHRAIPPRPAPLGKRLFWRVVLALAGTRAGKRLLLSLRRK